MRRVGYVLFALAGVSLVIAVVSLGLATTGSAGLRTRTVVYGIVNFGFAVVNVMLGLALLARSRAD